MHDTFNNRLYNKPSNIYKIKKKSVLCLSSVPPNRGRRTKTHTHVDGLLLQARRPARRRATCDEGRQRGYYCVGDGCYWLPQPEQVVTPEQYQSDVSLFRHCNHIASSWESRAWLRRAAQLSSHQVDRTENSNCNSDDINKTRQIRREHHQLRPRERQEEEEKTLSKHFCR